MTDPIRLAKHIAKSVPCSRRETELYIVGGWVTVGGKVVEEPQFKVSQQKVELQPVGAKCWRAISIHTRLARGA